MKKLSAILAAALIGSVASTVLQAKASVLSPWNKMVQNDIAGRQPVINYGFDGLWNSGNIIQLYTCAAAGTTTTTVPPGWYLLTVVNETTWICNATTCAVNDAGSNGTPLVVGTQLVVVYSAASTNISCRSTGATGNVTLTQLQAQ
jgi:hypothetical protein